MREPCQYTQTWLQYSINPWERYLESLHRSPKIVGECLCQPGTKGKGETGKEIRAVQHWNKVPEKSHPLKFSKSAWTKPWAAYPAFECSPTWSRGLDWVTSKGPFHSKYFCGSVMDVWNIEQPDLIIALEKSMTYLQLKPVLFPPPSHKARDRAEKGDHNLWSTTQSDSWTGRHSGGNISGATKSLLMWRRWTRNDWEFGDTKKSEGAAGLKWRGA